MRDLTLGAVLCLAVGASAGAATPDPQLMAPIQKFIDSFNKGDAAAAAATHLANADLAIIDEVPPHLWHGPQAFQTWSADLESDAKKHGLTEQVVTVGPPTREETNGDRAYVVVPAIYAFKDHGMPMRESGAQMTFVLKKGTGGWLIQGWSWTGPKPKRATPAKS
jgi:ketosteroid isomerase-like protein